MLKDRPHFGNGELRLFSDYRFFNHICKMINGVFTPPSFCFFGYCKPHLYCHCLEPKFKTGYCQEIRVLFMW